MKFILASSSPRRKDILSRLNIPFEILHPKVAEPKYDNKKTPKKYSEKLSKIKALSIAKDHKDSLVVGADTIVTLNDKTVLGKPENKEDAYRSLNMLSGKIHKVITGVTISYLEINYTFSETTLVKFLDLNKLEILNYINTDSPYDKAGSYGIQDYSSIFVEKIDGCYDNVLGFPLSKFYHTCKNILNIPI